MRRSHLFKSLLIGAAILLLSAASSQSQCITVKDITAQCMNVNSTQNTCTYQVTFTVTNNTTASMTLSPGAPISFPVTTVNAGNSVNINGTMTIPCGSHTVWSVVSSAPNCVINVGETLPNCNCTINAIAQDQSICKGGSTSVSFAPNISGTVAWYLSSPCAAPIPASGVIPWGWTSLPGGTTNSSQTPSLNQTTCFQAVVTNASGCQNPTVVSAPVTVTVIDPGSGSITCSGGQCPSDLCSNSTVNLTYSNLSGQQGCSLQWQKLNSVTSQWIDIPNQTSATLSTQTLTTSACPYEIIKFRMKSSCGACVTYTETNFKVYAPSSAGTIHTAPAGQNSICTGQARTLVLSGQCGDVQTWQSSTSGAINGSGADLVWNTNPLSQNTSYQVTVKNGPCSPDTSAPLNIAVTPKPTVTISGPAQFCALSQITATGSPPGGTYLWYLNGVIAPTPNGNLTYQASVGGNYYVTYTTGCGTAKSSPVTASKPIAIISGPCGICQAHAPPPQQIQLKSIVAGGVGNYTYHWTGPGIVSNPNFPNVLVAPMTAATYVVTIADSIGCTTTATHAVSLCPP